MKSFIEDVIRKFGGRMAGSVAEAQAQDYFEKVLAGICDTTSLRRFRAPLTSMHQSLKLFCLGFFLALFLSPALLWLAFALALANAVLFLGHFVTYSYWLDSLFPKQESSNVVGVIEPKGKVVSTLIFAGHMDSTTEYQWWYWLKNFGGFLTGLAGFLLVLLPFFLLAHGLARDIFGAHPPWANYYQWAFLALSPALATLFWMRNDRVVDGAQDNLSGVAAALGVAKALSGKENGGGPVLENTRVKIVSFGSEEAGLRGATAYAAEHLEELWAERAVLINLDGIMREKDLRIIVGELFPGVVYPHGLVRRMEAAFAACGQKPIKSLLPLGATDGAAFAMKGLPAITIIGQSTQGLDPTYHTRLDTPEHVEDKALEKTRDILVRFAKQWDNEFSG